MNDVNTDRRRGVRDPTRAGQSMEGTAQTRPAADMQSEVQTRYVAGIRRLEPGTPTAGGARELDGTPDESSAAAERFELSFSSETPYRRYDWWRGEEYDEILDHADGAVDLTRLRELGVVLYNHMRDEVIGRVLDVSISDGRGRATIAFDKDSESQRIADKVRAGTLRGVSVAYSVDRTERVCADGEVTQLYVRHWTPMEISIVSIPADTTVGVGRSMEGYGAGNGPDAGGDKMPYRRNEDTGTYGQEAAQVESGARATGDAAGSVDAGAHSAPASGMTFGRMDNMAHAAPASGNGGATVGGNGGLSAGTPAASAGNTVPVQPNATQGRTVDDILRAERRRVSEITALCGEFGVDAARYIDDGSTLDQVRAAVLEQLRARRPLFTAQVTRDESDKFRAAASDALLLRAGMRVDKPAEGARELRGLSLRDLLLEAVERDGGEAARDARGMRLRGASELFDQLISSRAYFSPTAAFPSILDQTIDKAYTQGYQLAPTTFEMWTQRGTLTDFKRTQAQWRRGDAGELLLVPEGGELKHDVPTDERQGGRELHTYGRQFTMTREAFINDDIGFLTSLPARYALSTKLTLNRQVYQVLAGNPALEDGHALFGSEHGNLATAGALNLANLVAAMEAMTTQRNARGQVIQVRPQYLIVPTGMGAYARMLLGSPTIKTTALSSSATEMQAANPVYEALQVVEDPELLAQLGAGGKYAWFLAANTATVDTIQVDYLNGVDTPTIRRMETPGQLGFVWDIYMDWGISVLDWRGLYKNPGAQPAAL